MGKGGHFRAWLREVDLELAKRCDLSHDDLADEPWWDSYHDGLTAAEAAGECLVNEGLPGLEEKPDEGR
jgi:hypothetical protein